MDEQAVTIDYEYWSLLIDIIKLVVTVLVAILAAWLGHRYWKKQKEIENRLKRQEIQYSSRAESCKAVWALLEYLSEEENPKTIIVTRGTQEKPETYCRLDKAKLFIQDIPRVLYSEGHGAFLTDGAEKKIKELRAKFYEFIESVLRKDAKQKENPDPGAFHTLEGFYKMIDDRPVKMEKIKNPKFVKGVRENASFLQDYLKSQLMGNGE